MAKLHNCCGTNAELKQLCQLLGTSDISEDLDALDEKIIKDYADTEGKVIIIQLPNSPEYFTVAFAHKTEKEFDPYEHKYASVASLCYYEEGPHLMLPLEYLQRLLDEEMQFIRQWGHSSTYEAEQEGKSL